MQLQGYVSSHTFIYNMFYVYEVEALTHWMPTTIIRCYRDEQELQTTIIICNYLRYYVSKDY